MKGSELIVGLLPERLKDILIIDENIWKRNLLILSFAMFSASVGMSAIVPFLPFYIRHLGVTDLHQAQLWSGLVFAGPFMVSFFAVPVWGALSDKYGRKLMIIRANLGLAVAVLMMGFAGSVTDLFILRIIQGAISGFIAATLGFTASNTPQDRSGFALAFISGSQNAGNILGPFIGGLIADFANIRSVFVFVSAMCFLGGIMVIAFLKEKNFKKDKDKHVSVFDNIKYAYSRKQLAGVLLMIVLSQAGIFFTNPIFAFFVEAMNPPKQYLSTITGLLVAIIGVFSVVTATYWGKRNDKNPHQKTIIIAGIISGATIIMHIFISNYILLFPLRSVTGIFLAALMPTLFAAVNKGVPAEIKSGIMSLASSASILGNLISYLLSGVVASNFGMQYCFIISGLLLITVAIIANIDRVKASGSVIVNN